MKSNRIEVSIICNAYNHEKYIRQCLDGFVMQKTNFAFEVLVHDDASTDSTAEIIRQYEEKYPNIIKPIYQNENQYSKDDGTISRIQYNRAQGKYIAFCEGDDYWIDTLKLQKQFEALEAYPEVDMCAHAAYVFVNGECKKNIVPKDSLCIIPTEEVILGDGGFVATNSLMYRKSIITDGSYTFRSVYQIDYSLQILGSLRGGMLYLPDFMSVYNFMTEGSWTSRHHNNPQKTINVRKKIITMLTVLNDETSKRFNHVIQYKINEILFELYYNYGPFYVCLLKKYRNVLKNQTMKLKVKILIKVMFPFMFSRYKWKVDGD